MYGEDGHMAVKGESSVRVLVEGGRRKVSLLTGRENTQL